MCSVCVIFLCDKPMSFASSNFRYIENISNHCQTMSTKATCNGLTVYTCGVISRIHVEHIVEWITIVAESRAVDRKLVLHEYTFGWGHTAFAQFGGFCRMDIVTRIRIQMFVPN